MSCYPNETALPQVDQLSQISEVNQGDPVDPDLTELAVKDSELTCGNYNA